LVLEGSDHGLSDYPDYLKEVLQFACFWSIHPIINHVF
jgi:hypothetical protein